MKNDSRDFFDGLALIGLLAFFFFLLCTGCRSEQLETGPLEPTTPHLVTSAPQEPTVNFKRPAYAQSIPRDYDYFAQSQPTPKQGLVARVKAKLTGKTVDKSRTTIIYNNAPTGNKNSNVATNGGKVTDQRKADLRGQEGGYKTKEKPKEVTKVITKTTPWYVFMVLILASVYIGARFANRLRWLPGLSLLVLLNLITSPVSAQKQLIVPHVRNYHYQEAKRIDRKHRHVLRRNHRQKMRELHQAAAEYRRRLRILKHC